MTTETTTEQRLWDALEYLFRKDRELLFKHWQDQGQPSYIELAWRQQHGNKGWIK